MSQLSILTAAPGLIFVTAIGYTVATVGMKLVSDNIFAIGGLMLALGLVGAIAAEIVLLRKTDLSVVYITIVASETLLVLIYASYIGEGFSIKQAAGALMVLVGMVLVTT